MDQPMDQPTNQQKELKSRIHVTKNGKHFFSKVNPMKYPRPDQAHAGPLAQSGERASHGPPNPLCGPVWVSICQVFVF